MESNVLVVFDHAQPGQKQKGEAIREMYLIKMLSDCTLEFSLIDGIPYPHVQSSLPDRNQKLMVKNKRRSDCHCY